MLRSIDHVVIACTDPDAAADELARVLGLAVTSGGRHEGLGTRNRICWLADGSYVELIGVEEPEVARRHPLGAAVAKVIDERSGGLAAIALGHDGLERDARWLQAAGSSIGEVVHGMRRRDDGEVVEWWTAVPAKPPPGPLPFLIEHALVGTEWSPSALRARREFRHPIGSPVLLTRVDIVADDPPTVAAYYHEQLNVDVWAVADLGVATIGPHTIRFVPAREMPFPAVVTLAAEIEGPRSVEALGLRFDVEHVELPLPTGV